MLSRLSRPGIESIPSAASDMRGRLRAVVGAFALGILAGNAAAQSAALDELAPKAIPVDQASVPRAAQMQADSSGLVHVLVELTQASGVQAYVKAVPAHAQVLTPSQAAVAKSAVAAQVAAASAQQASVAAAIAGKGIAYTEIYRVQRVKNAIAMIVPRSSIATIEALPGVKSVRPIIPSKPTSLVSVPYVLAPEVWQGLPSKQADGTGIKVGIIDTGIDYQHANFGGSGLLADYQNNNRVSNTGLDSTTVFPTAKVAGGYDLAGDNYDANGTYGSTTPTPDPNPIDCGGHGSHVAGTVAGKGVDSSGATFTGSYESPIDPDGMRIFPGMAPNATLYSFKVFGCGGSTDLVVQAIDLAMDPNQDSDFSDHMDVINMSLGSDFIGPTTLDAEASDAAAQVGVIVVAAAGNAGDTYLITGSPAAAPRAISVAASWDGGEQAISVNATSTTAPTSASYLGAPASFGPAFPTGPAISGNVVVASPLTGCTALTNAAAIAGKIALIQRGTCTFQTKTVMAQNAGAIAVILYDNVAEMVFSPSADTAQPAATIPTLLVGLADGTTLNTQASGAGVSTTLAVTSGGDLVASFSSRGPTNNMPLGAKPDITAPGVNVVSTQTGMTCVTGGGCISPTATGYDAGNQSLILSGTSMATPHVAGMMALLRQLHPSMSVEEMKALAMNGALDDIYTKPNQDGLRYGGGRVGAGRIDAQATANLSVIAYEASGSGVASITFPPEISNTTTVTKQLHVVNYGATAVTYTLAIDNVVTNPGITFSLPGGSTLTLGPGASTDIDVQMTGDATKLDHTFDPTIYATQSPTVGTYPRYWMTEATGYVNFVDADSNIALRASLYVSPYPAGAMTGGSSINTGGAGTGSTSITLAGTPVCTGTVSGSTCTRVSNTQEVGLVTGFEHQGTFPRDPDVPAVLNLRNVGVAKIGSSLYFGVQSWGGGSVIGAPGYDVEITVYTGNPSTSSPLFTLYPYVAQTSTPNATNVYFVASYKYSSGSSTLIGYPNLQSPTGADARIFQNDMLMYGASLSTLGLTATSKIWYYIDTWDEYGNLQQEEGPFYYDLAAPGVTFSSLLYYDMPGNTIPVSWNTANLATNASLGALLLHNHNALGSTGEALPLGTGTAPTLVSGVSRKVQGAAGTFDLALATDTGNPTTEPRTGPTQTLVFTFDKAITAATATVTEGVATAGSPTFDGNSVIVPLTAVNDVQYVTVTLSGVSASDGGTGGSAALRVGFLAGDVSGNRSVTLQDLAQVNAQQAQPVSATTFKYDVNANGSISAADLAVTNSKLTHVLPAP